MRLLAHWQNNQAVCPGWLEAVSRLLGYGPGMEAESGVMGVVGPSGLGVPVGITPAPASCLPLDNILTYRSVHARLYPWLDFSYMCLLARHALAIFSEILEQRPFRPHCISFGAA
jgi:hypothetical protein